ncbi:MAG: ATPase, T2SS/T4P/T4SS family [Bdellovibrionota bacterium]
MAGLLKQLQRNKPKSDADDRGAVLRSSVREDDLLADNSADYLLESGFVEDKATKAAPSTGARSKAAETEPPRNAPAAKPEPSAASLVGLGGAKLRAELDEAPWWLTEQQESNPQAELLLGAALEQFDTALIDADERQTRSAMQQCVQNVAERFREEIRLSRKLLEQVEQEMFALCCGKGPLEPLFEDSSVSDVFVDGAQTVRVIRRNHTVDTPFRFPSREIYLRFVHNLFRQTGRTFGPEDPLADCVLEDKWRTRVSGIDATLTENGEPRLCFRIPRSQAISFFDILQTKTLPATVAAWLAELMAIGEANVMIAGSEGAGKTVMMTALLSSVGSDERVVTIEELPEVFAPNSNVEKLFLRPGSLHDSGVTAADLLRAAARRSPHRIMLGEIDSACAGAFLETLERGFRGSAATILADSATDALWRLTDLLAADTRAPLANIIRRISRSVHVLLIMKSVDGVPCLSEVVELEEADGESFRIQPILRFVGVTNGKRQWQLLTRKSRWMVRLREQGLNLAPGPSLLPPDVAEVAEKPGQDTQSEGQP